MVARKYARVVELYSSYLLRPHIPCRSLRYGRIGAMYPDSNGENQISTAILETRCFQMKLSNRPIKTIDECLPYKLVFIRFVL